MSSIIILLFVLISLFWVKRNNLETDINSKEYVKVLSKRYAQEVRADLEPYFIAVEAVSKSVTGIVTNFKYENRINLLKNQLHSIYFKKEFIENTWILLSDNSNNEVSWTFLNMGVGGSIVKRKHINQSRIDNLLSQFKGSKVVISKPYNKLNKVLIDVYAPVFNSVTQIGFVGITVDLVNFSEYVITQMDYNYDNKILNIIDDSGIILGSENIYFIGKSYFDVLSDANNKDIEQGFKTGLDFNLNFKYNKILYYSYFTPLFVANAKWYVEFAIPQKVLFKELTKNTYKYIFIISLGLIFVLILLYFIIKRFLSPIKSINEILGLLKDGNLQALSDSKVKIGDDFQEIGDRLNSLISGLKKMETFTLEIEKGNFDNDFSPLSKEDNLGKALIILRDSISENIEKEKKRKEEEKQATWTTKGIAKFSDILRQDNTDIKKMGFNIVSNLVSYLNINQGALFVLNDEKETPFFELVSTVAYGREKIIQKEVALGEGLVGRCAYEKKTIFLVEVPDDYVSISSGLGESRPNCILIVPCVLNDVVYGVIEIAAFTALKPHEVEFVEVLGESVGSTIASVRVNEKTNKLLVDSQRKSEELASQEEELRQNLEEMETTQEDLKRQMDENTKMREDLLEQNALLDSLLETIPDYIYFKDRDCKFIKISRSMLSIFGAKTVDEVIGKSDFDYHTPENAQKFYDGEQRIIKTGVGIVNQLEKEIKVDGSIIWNNITKMPLLTSDSSCIGTFGISKDVTEIKNLEEETQKQKTELLGIINAIKTITCVVEYDKNGYILDVNDNLLGILKLNKDNVIGITNKEELVDNDIVDVDYKEFWKDLQKGNIRERKSKFIVDKKDIYLYEKYTPVFDKDNNVVKVIKVAFDITQV